MSSLLSGLTEKMESLPAAEDTSADHTLEEIRNLMSALNDRVGTVSETLNRLSEEA